MARSDPLKILLWNPSDEEVASPPRPRRIPRPHLAAIGKVIDAWGDLEFEIDRVIWSLMGVQQAIGACLTSQIASVYPKLNALRALLHLWGADNLADEIGGFTSGMRELSELRNRIVHDKRFILHPENAVVRFEITAPKKLTFISKVETVANLADLANRIDRKRQIFDDIRDRIREMRDASPDISQVQFLRVLEARDLHIDRTNAPPPQTPPPQSSSE